jgi:hypothetical protein
MTKSNTLNSLMGPERTWSKGRDRNTKLGSSTKLKGLSKQMREFEAAMASEKQYDFPSKKNQKSDAKLLRSQIPDECDERGDFFNNTHSSSCEHDGFDPEDMHGGQGELLEPCQLADHILGAGNQLESFYLPATDDHVRIDFQRYQDMIEKIAVNDTLPDNLKDVNIKFNDETLDGAQVTISKKGDRVKIRWQTTSESVYRLLSKQRFQLQQHVYSHLGIKSDVSVDFKKELKQPLAQGHSGEKTRAVRRGDNPKLVDAL